jgi:hypothetical protein
LFEGDALEEAAFKALVQEAAALNEAKNGRARRPR